MPKGNRKIRINSTIYSPNPRPLLFAIIPALADAIVRVRSPYFPVSGFGRLFRLRGASKRRFGATTASRPFQPRLKPFNPVHSESASICVHLPRRSWSQAGLRLKLPGSHPCRCYFLRKSLPINRSISEIIPPYSNPCHRRYTSELETLSTINYQPSTIHFR
jgi:hypothetical protein